MMLIGIGFLVKIIYSFFIRKFIYHKWTIRLEKFFDLIYSIYIIFFIRDEIIKSWIVVIFAPFISYLFYVLSCIMVGRKLSKFNLMFSSLYPLSNQIKKKYIKESLRNTYNASIEELIYRAAGFYFLNYCIKNTFLSMIIITIIFTFAHNLTKMYLVQKLDILVFSLLITLVYILSENILLVILIHILRNQFVIMQKYNDLNRDIKRAEQFGNILNRLKGKKNEKI